MQELKQMPIWVIWRYEMVNGSDLTNRYMTFTGNEVRNLPIKDCTDSILIFLETYMRKDLFQKKRTSVEMMVVNGIIK